MDTDIFEVLSSI